MNVDTERRDAEIGYTWGRAEGTYFLRNPDGDLKGVSENAMKLLEDMADGEVTEADLDGGASKLFEGLAAGEFVRPDGSRVEQVVRPDDIRLWPRVVAFLALFAAIVYVQANYTPSVEELRRLMTPPRIAVLTTLTIASIVVHESGHYLESRRYFDPTVRFGRINGIIPVVITNTSGAWMLPKNRRRWISLAGPFVELVWIGGLMLAYHLLFPGSLALNVFILSSIGSVVFSVNPLIHGDGYWLLVDTFDLVNLRKRGIQHLRNLRLSLPAAYVVVSYTFGAVVFSLSVVSMYFLYGLYGVAWPAVLLALAFVDRFDLWSVVVPDGLRDTG